MKQQWGKARQMRKLQEKQEKQRNIQLCKERLKIHAPPWQFDLIVRRYIIDVCVDREFHSPTYKQHFVRSAETFPIPAQNDCHQD